MKQYKNCFQIKRPVKHLSVVLNVFLKLSWKIIFTYECEISFIQVSRKLCVLIGKLLYFESDIRDLLVYRKKQVLQLI